MKLSQILLSIPSCEYIYYCYYYYYYYYLFIIYYLFRISSIFIIYYHYLDCRARRYMYTYHLSFCILACSAPEGLRIITYTNAVHTKEAIEVHHEDNSLQLWCHATAEGTDTVSTYVEASLFCTYSCSRIFVSRLGHCNKNFLFFTSHKYMIEILTLFVQNEYSYSIWIICTY